MTDSDREDSKMRLKAEIDKLMALDPELAIFIIISWLAAHREDRDQKGGKNVSIH